MTDFRQIVYTQKVRCKPVHIQGAKFVKILEMGKYFSWNLHSDREDGRRWKTTKRTGKIIGKADWYRNMLLMLNEAVSNAQRSRLQWHRLDCRIIGPKFKGNIEFEWQYPDVVSSILIPCQLGYRTTMCRWIARDVQINCKVCTHLWRFMCRYFFRVFQGHSWAFHKSVQNKVALCI